MISEDTSSGRGVAVGARTLDPKKLCTAALIIAGLFALAIAPFVISAYYTTLLIPFFAYAIVLLGFNLLFGYGGLLSFGHALFVSVGAYAAAAIAAKLGVVSIEGMFFASIISVLLVSIPIAWIVSKFTGIFFGMLTLSFGMLAHSFLNKFYNITGGDSGMRIPRPSILGMEFEQMNKLEYLSGPFYFYCLILFTALMALMWLIVRSPFGIHLQASRDNELKATYLGVRVRQVRAVAFIISALYAGVGGVILGVNTGLADPELAYWTHSGHLVFMAVLGGYQEFLGPVIGALAFIFLQDELNSLTEYWRFFMGVILAGLVILLPGGVMGALRKIRSRRTDR